MKDGELQVGDDGSLLLSPAVYSLVSGSGASGIHDMSSNSLYPPSHEALPPLPVDVDTVDFTWVATGTVSFDIVMHNVHIICSCQGIYNVRLVKIIPRGSSVTTYAFKYIYFMGHVWFREYIISV